MKLIHQPVIVIQPVFVFKLSKGEAPDGQDIEHVFDTLGVCLVEYDEYADEAYVDAQYE